MQTSGWVAASIVASAAVATLAAAPAARADDDDHGTPFDQGRVGVMLTVGEQSAFGYNHVALGAGAGYFVLDGLELSAFALHEFGSGPSIDEVSPAIRYVAQPLVGRWPVIPYGAAFYNHWFLGDGFSDLDTIGGRAGLLTLRGRLIVGLGVAVEHVLSSCTECNYVYPDVTFGFSF